MTKRKRKWIAALLCGMLAVRCMIPVEAANHTCVPYEIQKVFLGYEDKDDGHAVSYRHKYACQVCGGYMLTEVSVTMEDHNRNAYRDLGHQRETTHKYAIYCGICGGGSQEIYLNTCDWAITGRHTTPW